MAINSITPLPTPVPSRADPTNFANRADAFLGALPTFGAELNTFATDANNLATDMQTDRDAVEQVLVDVIAQKETIDDLYDSTVAVSNFKGLWSSLTGALNKPASVYHSGYYWFLLNDLANVTTSTPSTTNTDWLLVDSELRYRNFIINPNFLVNQEFPNGSVTVTAGSAEKYVSDQWFMQCSGGNTSVERALYPLSTAPTRLNINPSIGTTSYTLAQRIEALDSFNLFGKTCTLNFDFQMPTDAVLNVSIVKINNLGNRTTLQSTSFTGNNNTQNKNYTFSIAGLGLSPANNKLEIVFNVESNAPLGIDNIWLGLGNKAPKFTPRPFQQELALCQRYYEEGIVGFNGGYQAGGSGFHPMSNFIVPKHTSPTISLTVTSSSNLTSITASALSNNSFRYGGTASTTGVVTLQATYKANARL